MKETIFYTHPLIDEARKRGFKKGVTHQIILYGISPQKNHYSHTARTDEIYYDALYDQVCLDNFVICYNATKPTKQKWAWIKNPFKEEFEETYIGYQPGYVEVYLHPINGVKRY